MSASGPPNPDGPWDDAGLVHQARDKAAAMARALAAHAAQLDRAAERDPAVVPVRDAAARTRDAVNAVLATLDRPDPS